MHAVPDSPLESRKLGLQVACSSYVTLAVTVDGRVFTWGDCDGQALGHEDGRCDAPRWAEPASATHDRKRHCRQQNTMRNAKFGSKRL